MEKPGKICVSKIRCALIPTVLRSDKVGEKQILAGSSYP